MYEKGVRVLLATSPNDPKFLWHQNEEACLLDMPTVAVVWMTTWIIHPIEDLFEEISALAQRPRL